MKHDIAGKLELITSKKEPLIESEASHLLTLVRKTIEHMDYKEKAKYPILRFYCDWALHIKIDRSPAGLEIIKKLNSTIVKYKNVPDNDLIIEKISKVISLQKLRSETKKLFKSAELPLNFVTDNQKWGQFLDLLVEILLDCKVVLPKRSKKTKELYKSLISRPIKKGVYVVGFKLTKIDKSVFEKKPVASGISWVCLDITTSNTTHLVIPLRK